MAKWDMHFKFIKDYIWNYKIHAKLPSIICERIQRISKLQIMYFVLHEIAIANGQGPREREREKRDLSYYPSLMIRA